MAPSMLIESTPSALPSWPAEDCRSMWACPLLSVPDLLVRKTHRCVCGWQEGAAFEQAAEQFIQSYLDRRIPSLFSTLKPLYRYSAADDMRASSRLRLRPEYGSACLHHLQSRFQRSMVLNSRGSFGTRQASADASFPANVCSERVC